MSIDQPSFNRQEFGTTGDTPRPSSPDVSVGTPDTPSPETAPDKQPDESESSTADTYPEDPRVEYLIRLYASAAAHPYIVPKELPPASRPSADSTPPPERTIAGEIVPPTEEKPFDDEPQKADKENDTEEVPDSNDGSEQSAPMDETHTEPTSDNPRDKEVSDASSRRILSEKEAALWDEVIAKLKSVDEVLSPEDLQKIIDELRAQQNQPALSPQDMEYYLAPSKDQAQPAPEATQPDDTGNDGSEQKDAALEDTDKKSDDGDTNDDKNTDTHDEAEAIETKDDHADADASPADTPATTPDAPATDAPEVPTKNDDPDGEREDDKETGDTPKEDTDDVLEGVILGTTTHDEAKEEAAKETAETPQDTAQETTSVGFDDAFRIVKEFVETGRVTFPTHTDSERSDGTDHNTHPHDSTAPRPETAADAPTSPDFKIGEPRSAARASNPEKFPEPFREDTAYREVESSHPHKIKEVYDAVKNALGEATASVGNKALSYVPLITGYDTEGLTLALAKEEAGEGPYNNKFVRDAVAEGHHKAPAESKFYVLQGKTGQRSPLGTRIKDPVSLWKPATSTGAAKMVRMIEETRDRVENHARNRGDMEAATAVHSFFSQIIVFVRMYHASHH